MQRKTAVSVLGSIDVGVVRPPGFAPLFHCLLNRQRVFVCEMEMGYQYLTHKFGESMKCIYIAQESYSLAQHLVHGRYSIIV